MKKRFILWTGRPVIISLIFFLGLALPLHAATEGGIKKGVEDFLFEKKAYTAVEDYTENTVFKTIELLVQEIENLNTAVAGLSKSRTDADMAKTIEAWKGAMAQFNRHWAFNYGPAAHYDFHKQLATWPFDKVWVDHYLDEIEKGNLEVTARFLRKNKHSSTRGLNTAAYLLFRDGKVRPAKKITPAELKYLRAVSQALLIESVDFEASWRGTKNLSKEKRKILKDAGVKKRSSYAVEFTNPGESDSRYTSISIPLQEIFQECTTVIEDMVAGFSELGQVQEKSAYWDSIDPYADALDMLKGVENSYYGGVDGARDASLSDLVAKKNQILDRRIKASLAHSMERIKAVRDLPSGADAQTRELMVKIAVSECEKLFDRITAATPLVTADSAVKPWAAYGR